MKLGLDLDLGITAIFMTCALLGFVRGFVMAAIGFLILISMIFISLAVAESSFPVVIYSSAVEGSLSKMSMDISSSINAIKGGIYLTGIGVFSPIIGALVRDFGRRFGSDLESGMFGRIGGAFVGLIHCGVIFVGAYIFAGSIMAPKDWAPGLKRGYSLSLIYEIGKSASDALLPESMRPAIKSLTQE